MNAVRTATRELRWEQVQAAIADLLSQGNVPITIQEVAQRTSLSRSTLGKDLDCKVAIQQAEAERQRRRAAELQQLRIGFVPGFEGGTPPASLEQVIMDLRALFTHATEEARRAYDLGRQEGEQSAPMGVDPALLAEARAAGAREATAALQTSLGEAFEQGRERGRQESAEALQGSVGEAFERGRERGRHEATAELEPRLKEVLAQGLEQGRSQFEDDLNSAYLRGVADGKADGTDAYEQGRQMGRAEATVELKAAQERWKAEAKTEARAEVAAELHHAYDRGRHDGWEEGRREGAGQGGRGFFGFNGTRSNPDREWALAVLHCATNSTVEQQRLAYRTLTKVYHPDRNPELPPDFIRNLNRAKDLLGL